jgi:hypothetical protein
MARCKTKVSSSSASNPIIIPDTTHDKPYHRTAKTPEGVLLPSTIPITTQFAQAQKADPSGALRLMPAEFEAVISLKRLGAGFDAYQTRQSELARSEVEDPVDHYYAQTVEERAPYRLQAACVLFEMSGQDLTKSVVALTLIGLRRWEEMCARKATMVNLLEYWRVRPKASGNGEAVTSM